MLNFKIKNFLYFCLFLILIGVYPHNILAIETATYNFTGVTISNDGVSPYPIATEHDSDVFPWTIASDKNSSLNPNNNEYINISTDNTLEWVSIDPGSDDFMATDFVFYIQQVVADISNVQVRWNGNSEADSNHSIWLRRDGLSEFGGTNTWFQLGSSLLISANTDTDLIRSLTSSFSTYINNSTDRFEFVVFGDNPSRRMRTNYVEVEVEYDTPPNFVSDLSTSNLALNSIDLNWTASGDDSNIGTATTYDIRYSTSVINDVNWASATQVSGEPTPSVAGTSESMTISSLSSDTNYYFGIKTSDEVPNESALSNIVNATTHADSIFPSTISDLSLSNITSSSVDLNWTASGDDNNTGTASVYDIRYSTSVINDGNWASATQVLGEPTPSVAGTSESMTISGLSSNITYYFGIKVRDDSSNESGLSNIVTGTTRTIATPTGGVSPARIVFSGKAYPKSEIKVLMKNNIDPLYTNEPETTHRIDEDGDFFIEYVGLLSGNYFVSINAIDVEGNETGTMSFNVDFFTEPSLIVENILFSPTMKLEKEILTTEDNIIVSGYASLNSDIEFSLDNNGNKFNTKPDETGYYSFNIPASDLGEGTYFAKVKQTLLDNSSSYSYPITLKISSLTLNKPDLNDDTIVDIVDWSIFLFRWGEKSNPLRNTIDLNYDGIIDIKDFSIFLKSIKI